MERGFSTLLRNLTATRSSLGNTRLNAVLVIKTNSKVYHEKKKWRCHFRSNIDNKKHDKNDNALFGPLPPKRTKIFDPVDERHMIISDESLDESSDESELSYIS